MNSIESLEPIGGQGRLPLAQLVGQNEKQAYK